MIREVVEIGNPATTELVHWLVDVRPGISERYLVTHSVREEKVVPMCVSTREVPPEDTATLFAPAMTDVVSSKAEAL